MKPQGVPHGTCLGVPQILTENYQLDKHGLTSFHRCNRGQDVKMLFRSGATASWGKNLGWTGRHDQNRDTPTHRGFSLGSLEANPIQGTLPIAAGD